MTTNRHRRLYASAFAALLIAAAARPAPTLAMTQMSPEMRALAQACRADFNQLCPGVQPGGGRVLACLQNNSSKLTPPCRDAMAKAPAKPAT